MQGIKAFSASLNPKVTSEQQGRPDAKDGHDLRRKKDNHMKCRTQIIRL